MPRPPKHVPPDTLGGRIRAARENLHLSLARVAADRYSTSLISQIERNRVDPSQDSLQFLAEQLHLPLEDLKMLALSQRETTTEALQYKTYEQLRIKASQALAGKCPYQARDLLQGLNLSQIPSALRWRLAALRGQCNFTLREFLAAQGDFMYAVTELPEVVPADQHLEAMTLHLHLAATLRELEQPGAAFERYQAALKMMNTNTSVNDVAEAHWGMSLVAYEQAQLSEYTQQKEHQLRVALEHAENACVLYRTIGETRREALLNCQIGLIEQASGKPEDARKRLTVVLHKWLPKLEQYSSASTPPTEKRHVQEIANVISVVACSLAGIELEANNHQQALEDVQQAKQAGRFSYILRRAEAEMMLGRILEAINVQDAAAEEAFRKATTALTATYRIAARIRAHDFLGRHLLKKGDVKAGEEELNHARRLSRIVSTSTSPSVCNGSETDDVDNVLA